MILSSQTIRRYCEEQDLISPFYERTRHEGMTFGLSPAGYDVRVEFGPESLYSYRILNPGDFILASTVERFKMPNDLIASVADKSSWARRGLAVQNTIIEPGWEGWLTLELTNHGRETLRIEKGMAIAQIVFQRLDFPTDQPYEGKYQDQRRGPVGAIRDISDLSNAPGQGKVRGS